VEGINVGLALAFVAVAAVLAWMGAMAWFGSQAAFASPSLRTMRRMGLASIVLAGFQLTWSVVLLAGGDFGRALRYGVGAAILIVNGRNLIRSGEPVP
jgi:hypothetical protein